MRCLAHGMMQRIALNNALFNGEVTGEDMAAKARMLEVAQKHSDILKKIVSWYN